MFFLVELIKCGLTIPCGTSSNSIARNILRNTVTLNFSCSICIALKVGNFLTLLSVSVFSNVCHATLKYGEAPGGMGKEGGGGGGAWTVSFNPNVWAK